MMRALDRRRTAAIVLCLLGCLVSKAATKTVPEDTATEGKSALKIFVRQKGELAGYFGG